MKVVGVSEARGGFREGSTKNRPKAVRCKRAHDAHRSVHARVGKPGSYAPVSPHGVGGGTAHGPSTSIDLKSAGPTISRYSMSGE